MRRSVYTFTETPHVIVGLGTALVAIVFVVTFAKGLTLWLGSAIALFSALSALRSLGATILVTGDSLTRRSPFGEVRIMWRDLDGVEIGPGCRTLLFSAGDKQVWMRRPAESVAAWFKAFHDHEVEEDALDQLLYMADVKRVSAEKRWLTPLRVSRGHE